MRIFDFSSCPFSDRNGTYGGNSGDKEGVLIENEPWIIKYPKKGSRLTNVSDLLYSTTPVSEYIGSHVYEILGYPVHKTLLGIRNNHVVVACKDLCKNDTRLIEFRQLKNTYNKVLNEKLDLSMSPTGSEHFVLLNEVLIHLEYNPSINNIPGIKERFWDCVVIDGFINNNDRNNGNWGILRNKSGDVLSPIYDNGAAFSPNVPEKRIINKLNNLESLEKGIYDSVTAYSLDSKSSSKFVDLLKLDNDNLKNAIKRVVPLLQNKMIEICDMLSSIPESVGEFSIISKDRKQLYQKEMEFRLEKILLPEYNRLISVGQTQNLKNTKNKSDDYNRGY